MRFKLIDHRRRLLRQATVVAILAGLGAGCSSDYTRNNWSLYTKSIEADQDQYSSANPYPAGVDGTTTSSVSNRGGGTPVPNEDVTPRPVAPDHAGYELTPPADRSRTTAYSRYGSTNRKSSSETRAVIARTELPPAEGSGRYGAGVDPVRTSGVKREEPLLREGGWSSAGGTAVTLRDGETLYNLSKRYGVPVAEIMKANGIRDASHVRAGQSIVIPTYAYSRNAPISAPDNDLQTRYARAGVGSRVVPELSSIPEPQWRPHRYALRSETTRREVAATRETIRTSGGNYVVAGGDTLAGIARRNDLSLSELQAANGLSGTSIRVGQTLVIPGRTDRRERLATLDPGVDPIVTGSKRASDDVPEVRKENIREAKAEAPAQTGIGQFRWPVRGRVISSFGEKTGAGRNDGIDISVPEGTAVKAAENGVVVYSGDELEGFGNLLLVRHTDGWVSAYAHNKMLEVKRGDEVRRGQIIARSGRTGNAELPKLHFELRKNSSPVDPLKHLGGA